ncbi:MAG: porphobilinogen deaminase [Cyclobacteriaceae bacterium]|nr:MAG: porphobilinogen deaminase [Cyclobacteriaceae bacterium]
MQLKISIGTRKSTLAVWQAKWVASRLEMTGAICELVLMDTKGDRMLNVAIPEIGSKGVFTEDLEHALAAGTIDLAVHSAKDMPSELPKGFEIIAYSPREQAHDVLVSDKAIKNLNHLIIGTSSVRRVAILKHYYPGIRTVSVRGNLQTRIKKLESSKLDAVMLAFAGVQRLGLAKSIKYSFPLDKVIPAVGQGSMAIEVSSQLDRKKRELIRDSVNHPATTCCLLAERAFLSTIQGGCSIPAFAHARHSDGKLFIQGGVVSLDGSRKIQRELYGEVTQPEEIGVRLGKEVMKLGGKEILDEIKSNGRES